MKTQIEITLVESVANAVGGGVSILWELTAVLGPLRKGSLLACMGCCVLFGCVEGVPSESAKVVLSPDNFVDSFRPPTLEATVMRFMPTGYGDTIDGEILHDIAIDCGDSACFLGVSAMSDDYLAALLAKACELRLERKWSASFRLVIFYRQDQIGLRSVVEGCVEARFILLQEAAKEI